MISEPNFGKLFHDFRKAKGYTLKEAADDAISVSQLSNFENGKNGLSIYSCLKILENINVTLNEFHYAYQLLETSKDLRSAKTSAYLTKNIIQLKSIIKEYGERIK